MEKITEQKHIFLDLMSDALEVKALLDLSIGVFKSENFIEFDRLKKNCRN